MSDWAKELVSALSAKPAQPIDEWRKSPGKYECPACGSTGVAREKLETTRYYEDGSRDTDVVRSIRCMACGEHSGEGSSMTSPYYIGEKK